VSHDKTTSRKTTRTSARIDKPVDAGFVSFAKSQSTSFKGTRDALRRGFFIAAHLVPRHAESVPARVARRRLVAGPTPATSLRTGQF
jgi:hypothetical protein